MGTILTEAGSRELKVTVVNQKNTADPVNTFEEAVYRGDRGTLAITVKTRGS